ncbi:MAG: hypothetical protein ABI680_19840 [Chthoniobacteraceae bacterium]
MSRSDVEDLVNLCRELNERGARYVVVGGFAIIQAGYDRHTKDIDLLVDVSAENESALLEALATLPDNAVRELKRGEIAENIVVRVADEFMVDVMQTGCGVGYAEAKKSAVIRVVDGVSIPFASVATLWRMKQTVREKDAPDRLFLRQTMENEGIPLDPPPARPVDPLAGVPAWLRAVVGWFARRGG